jgi:hypothetical protein
MNGDELSAEERLLAEQAVMNRRALHKACREAPDGQVLAIAEQLAKEQGREFIRRMLESSLQGFTTDGTSANTTEGWREMKRGMFSKRQRGEPATPAE